MGVAVASARSTPIKMTLCSEEKNAEQVKTAVIQLTTRSRVLRSPCQKRSCTSLSRKTPTPSEKSDTQRLAMSRSAALRVSILQRAMASRVAGLAARGTSDSTRLATARATEARKRASSSPSTAEDGGSVVPPSIEHISKQPETALA
jgi:hypothetical protein